MASYISGACGIGCHEGTIPRNFQGKALPTCKMTSADCSCSCHTTLDEMFRLSEMERVLVNESAYVPDRADFVMPSPAELAEARLERSPVPVERIESPDPDRVPAAIARTYAPTATGRSGRGELEQQVDEACRVWVIEQDSPTCSPKYIGEQIGRKYGIKEPSSGAIGSIFDRWVNIGYADCQRKPVRFVAYTDLAREIGLEGCKLKARRRKEPK